VCKFSNSDTNVPSVTAIPHGVLLSMSLDAALQPGQSARIDSPAILAPIARLHSRGNAAFCGVHIYAGYAEYGP